ncbi:MAG TPA: GGDEF domain-containing protein [Gaiellaceae bacterium]|jgi:diguanylate cyclase (GGDEF)-like protein|nr:GGDEF domain-containing protein [Gaiellaceae bacterium]
MVTAARHRVSLLALSLVLYAVVSALLLTLERPGLGLGHLYYLPIALVAFATGPIAGAGAGVVAASLYNTSVILNPDLPSHLHPEQTAIRLAVYASMGLLIGWFSRRNRQLVGQLRELADRDSVTSLPNTRSFQKAIDARLDTGEPFALVVGNVDELAGEGEAGDDVLWRLADRLLAAKRTTDDVARVGGDEFAILGSLEGGEDARSLALTLEERITLAGDSVTFGWAQYPADGENALALYRAADERLYARKVSRGFSLR